MESAEKDRLAGYGYAVLAATLWALLGPVSRLCFAGGVEPLEVAFWRAAIGALCFAVHGAFKKQLGVPARHAAYFLGFGLTGVGLFFYSYQLAVKEGGAALAVVLLYTAPAWVALLSRILFKEAFTRLKSTALLVAMLGTGLVCFSGGSLGAAPSVWGLGCGLGAGLLYATHYPFYNWWQSRYSTATLYTYMLLAGALAIYPFLDISLDKSLITWGALLFLGCFCTYGAYLAYGQGLRRISPVRAAVVSNFEPVFGTLLAWAWWGENFSHLGWLGFALVLGAVFLLTSDRR